MTSFISRSSDRTPAPVERGLPQGIGVRSEQRPLAEAVLESVRQILPEALQPVAPRTAGNRSAAADPVGGVDLLLRAEDLRLPRYRAVHV